MPHRSSLPFTTQYDFYTDPSPLLAFGRVMPTIGFDISEEKVNAYRKGYDPTGEMESELFARAEQLNNSSLAPTFLTDSPFKFIGNNKRVF